MTALCFALDMIAITFGIAGVILILYGVLGLLGFFD